MIILELSYQNYSCTHIRKLLVFCTHWKYSLDTCTWYVLLYKTRLLITHNHLTHIIYWLFLDKYCLYVKFNIILKHFNDILPILKGSPYNVKIFLWKKDVPALLINFQWNSVNANRTCSDLSGDIFSQVGRQRRINRIHKESWKF